MSYIKWFEHITKNDALIRRMENGKKVYGSNAGHKVISVLSRLMKNGERPFKWAHEVLGLWKETSKGIEYL